MQKNETGPFPGRLELQTTGSTGLWVEPLVPNVNYRDLIMIREQFDNYLVSKTQQLDEIYQERPEEYFEVSWSFLADLIENELLLVLVRIFHRLNFSDDVIEDLVLDPLDDEVLQLVGDLFGDDRRSLGDVVVFEVFLQQRIFRPGHRVHFTDHLPRLVAADGRVFELPDLFLELGRSHLERRLHFAEVFRVVVVAVVEKKTFGRRLVGVGVGVAFLFSCLLFLKIKFRPIIT